MRINVETEIVGLDGQPILDGKGTLVLRDVLTRALTELPAGEKPDWKSSVKKFNLAIRLQEDEQVELAVADVQLLMELVGSMYTPLVAGRVCHLLDPTTKGNVG